MMSSDPTEEKRRITRRTALTSAAGLSTIAIAGCTQSDSGGGSDGGSESTEASGEDGGGSGSESEGGSSSESSEMLSGDIGIAGSSTVFPLATAVAEIYSEDHPQVNIDISSTGSGGGFSNFFCVGETDFNNASRPIKEEEAGLCEENGVEYVELVVATDALTVVVSNDNDYATELTVEQLAEIWAADGADTWSEINSSWPDKEINRFGAADTSGTFDYFGEQILGERAHTDDYQATEQDNTIAQGVQGDRLAIGYFGFSYFYNNPDQLTSVAIADGGDTYVKPSLEAAASGEYTPLSRPLFTYPAVESLAEEHVADFAQFFVDQTDNESLVAGDVGYVPATQSLKSEQVEKLNSAIEQAQN
jgi:phosphate transport system substrate-binding protein